MTIREKNKMGTMPIPKLLLTMSLPMMISMFIQALYNVVDSLFVANIDGIGEASLTALALAQPMQMLVISFAVGIGVGINAVLSRSLGEENYKKADLVIGNIIIILAVFSLIFFIFSVFLTRNYFEIQTSNQLVIDLGTSYLKIITAFSFAKLFQIGFERMLQATGRTVLTMISQSTGAFLNILLDYILIIRLNMGIEGAAIATIIAQFVALLMVISFNIYYNKDININIRHIKANKQILKEIFTIAIPSILMQASMSLAGFIYNLILINVSEAAVTANGIYYKFNNFIVMPVFGINNALIPIISYNFGAKLYQRIKDTIKYSIFYSSIILVIGFIVVLVFPEFILDMFNASSDLKDIGLVAFRILAFHYLIIAISVPLEGALQALNRNKQALLETIIRLMGVQLPLAYIITLFNNAQYNVWYAAVIAEGVACIYVVYVYKKIKLD